MTAVRDDDDAPSAADLRALALYLATVDRRGAASTAVAHVLHDLGNPAAVLGSNLRYVVESLDALAAALDAKATGARRLLDELRGAVDDAVAGAAQLTERLNRFRAAVEEPQAAGGAPALADAGCELARAVELAVAVVAPIAGRTRVEQRLPARLPRVAAATEGVAATVVQLLLNAVEAAAPQVTVSAARADDGARALVALTVEDDGPGLAPEVRAQVARALVTSRSGGGRGLGLARARAALVALGGALHVVELSAGGLSVRALLPVAR